MTGTASTSAKHLQLGQQVRQAANKRSDEDYIPIYRGITFIVQYCFQLQTHCPSHLLL